MENEILVGDAVLHGFALGEDSVLPGDHARMLCESVFHAQWTMLPDGYRKTRAELFCDVGAEELGRMVFEESRTSFAVYQPVVMRGVFRNGMAPLDVGVELRSRYPGQVILFGAVNALDGSAAIQELERQHAEHAIAGLKLYPVEYSAGQFVSVSLADRERIFPLLEACRRLDIRHVAVHKAIPLGLSPMEPFNPSDVAHAAYAFPDLNFELVHSGFAFLEETVDLIGRYPNMYVNLESTGDLLPRYPQRFARILGEMLYGADHRKILWGTGASAVHPRPLIEAFLGLEFSDELRAEYGYPELTMEIKRDILGRNLARVHGLDEGSGDTLIASGGVK